MFKAFDPSCWILLAQEKGGDAPPLGGFEQLLGGPWIPLGMVMVLFYVLMIRPERRKRAALAQMLKNLKKNDRVVTIGGILGTVVNIQKDSDVVVLKVDDSGNARLRFQRSAIARVVSDDGSASSKNTS